jgi:peptide/nickel transport system permease protein
MAVLELERDDVASAEPVRRQRRIGALFIFAVAWIVLIGLAAIFANWLPIQSPTDMDLLAKRAAPFSDGHLLGTDHLGRDILSRVIYGARVSLVVGGLAVLGAGLIGVTIGLLAGYFRGVFDAVVTMIAEIQQSFPFLALAIVVVAAIGRGVTNIVAVLIVGGWILFARVVRGEAMSISRRQFVDGARALGAGHTRILLRHILPNVRSSIIVITTFNFAWFIITEASLSFLGLGVDPDTPSWGQMLSDSRNYLALAWWYPAFPGIALVALVLGANMLGDGLQDRWDPYLK